MANMLPSEENKYDQFLNGLHVTIRSGLASFMGTTYRSLVEKALEVEKLKKVEREVFQKGQKHSQSSFYDSNKQNNRGVDIVLPRSGYGNSG